MRVLKFGGTSVATAEALQQVVQIIQGEVASNGPCMVVASATAGTTNKLLQAATLAPYRCEDARQILAHIADDHHTLAREVMDSGSLLHDTLEHIDAHIQRALDLVDSMHVLQEWTEQSSDALVMTGELLSTAILAALLQGWSTPVSWIPATELLQTDDAFGAATVHFPTSQEQCRRRLLPVLREGMSVVTQGFIGATADGLPTTLGRGGSDASASILGACVAAEEVQIWTDVSGVYSADPRLIPTARPISSLHVGEIRELALYGAKVVHPEAILPALEAGIRVRILNTFAPQDAGTVITNITNDAEHHGPLHGPLHAVSAVQNCVVMQDAPTDGLPLPCLLELHTVDHSVKVFQPTTAEQRLLVGTAPTVAVLCLVGPAAVHNATLHMLGDALQEIDVLATVMGTSPWAVYAVVPQSQCLQALQQVHTLLGS